MKVEKLIKLYKIPVLRKFARQIILILGADIPLSVKIGNNVGFPHNAIGTVIHDKTVIEDNVKIYQNVTIGRGDIYIKETNGQFEGFVIKNGACICAGAKVICKQGKLEIGENSVVGANAVLLNSIGAKEIWGGYPLVY